MKAQSVLPAVIAIVVAIIALVTAVYVYLNYHYLTTAPSTITNTTSTSGKTLLRYDSSNKTVYLTIAVLSTVSTLNFNGTTNGQLVIYVPAGWSLYVTFINYQSLPHNLIILQNDTPTPNSPDVAQFGKILYAFGATSSNYETTGISSGQSVSGLTDPLSPGIYMLVCGIYSHAESGMWAVLVVSQNVTAPYAVVT
ncbi:MAG: sulfocyanin [Sulfolobaceae archaeon]|nr:sulfocyanin [Sulfolobaceae archaeon]